MIAEIQPSFSSHLSMSRKIEYQLSKVKEGAFPMNSGFLLPGNISRGWGTESPVMPLS